MVRGVSSLRRSFSRQLEDSSRTYRLDEIYMYIVLREKRIASYYSSYYGTAKAVTLLRARRGFCNAAQQGWLKTLQHRSEVKLLMINRTRSDC